MHVHMHVHRDEVTGQTWYCFTFPTHTRKAPSFYILFIKYKRFFSWCFWEKRCDAILYRSHFCQKPRERTDTVLAAIILLHLIIKHGKWPMSTVEHFMSQHHEAALTQIIYFNKVPSYQNFIRLYMSNHDYPRNYTSSQHPHSHWTASISVLGEQLHLAIESKENHIFRWWEHTLKEYMVFTIV